MNKHYNNSDDVEKTIPKWFYLPYRKGCEKI